MEYQEFKEELFKELTKGLPEEQGYRISVQAQKEMDVLQVTKAGWDYTAEMSCKNLYKILPGLGGRMDKLAEMIQDTVHEADQIMRMTDKIQEVDLKDYDRIKHLLRVELVRSECNGVFLSEGIYEKQTFGALVPYIAVPVHDGIVQTRISPGMLEAYGVSQRELMDQAMANSRVSNRAVLLRIEGKGDDTAYIVTGTERHGGATAILYPGILEELREKIGKDYFIVPATTDAVYAVGKSERICADKVKTAFGMIMPIVNPKDRLDSKVYEYSGAEKKLSVSKKEKSRKMER